MIAQQRDQALYSGTAFVLEFSISSIPDEVVVARAETLGVSLGKSPSQVVNSINSIKDIDIQRTLVMLKRNEEGVKK
jgi:hypothetical protein